MISTINYMDQNNMVQDIIGEYMVDNKCWFRWCLHDHWRMGVYHIPYCPLFLNEHWRWSITSKLIQVVIAWSFWLCGGLRGLNEGLEMAYTNKWPIALCDQRGVECEMGAWGLTRLGFAQLFTIVDPDGKTESIFHNLGQVVPLMGLSRMYINMYIYINTYVK